MSVSISIEVTPKLDALVARLGADLERGLQAGLQHVVADIEGRALDHVPVRTSNLYNSITSYVTGLTGVIKATAPYAEYVHEGTGIYGPKKHRIVPREAKALRFEIGGKVLYRRSVKGMKGVPFFTLAIKEADPQKVFEQGVMNFLRRRGW
jgi:hypothetical protein